MEKEKLKEAKKVITDLLAVIKYNHAVVEGCYPVKGPNEREIKARAEKLISE